MKLWNTDNELFTIAQQELCTCVVGDVMDKLQLLRQFLPPQIQPLRQDMVVIGRAMPVLSVDVFEESAFGTANKLMEKPFGLMLEALDDLRPNEVYVNTGSSPRNALWGRTHDHPGSQIGECWRCAEWLHTRHEGYSPDELSHFLLRVVWPGFRTALQGI